jgi:arylsulfatase A-like enzyme
VREAALSSEPKGQSLRTLFVLATLALASCTRGNTDPAGPKPGIPLAAAAAPPPKEGSPKGEAPRAEVDAAPPKPTRPPADLNVIVISVDSLRADMPWAGYPRPIAPRLTELEKRAVSYTRSYAISSYTSMSLGGLLGGKYPSEMKRDGFFFGTYPKDDLLFPEILQAAKIHTLGAHAHGYFRDQTFQQGFDRWEVVPNLKWSNTTDENVTSAPHEALAEKLLSEKACDEGRFFAWFHFMDPHDGYQSHADVPPYGKTIRDRYDAEVTYTDRYIGKLLDFIAAKPWAARTAILVTADHGEAFGEHKQYAHGFELYENLVRVPLFFVVPGADARHIDTATSAIDIAPTILDLFGLPPEPTFEGKSLVPELFGAAPEPRDIVLDLPMTSDSDRRRALVHGEQKIIAFGNDQAFRVFDLTADPTESNGTMSGDAFTDMLARYRAVSKQIKDIAPYGCKETCLNGAYLKKDAGAPAP